MVRGLPSPGLRPPQWDVLVHCLNAVASKLPKAEPVSES